MIFVKIANILQVSDCLKDLDNWVYQLITAALKRFNSGLFM